MTRSIIEKRVADARVRASGKREQIAEDARDGLDSLGNDFPAFVLFQQAQSEAHK